MTIQPSCPREFVISLLVGLIVGPPCPVIGQQKFEVAPAQKSDSFVTDESGRKMRIQIGEMANTNFQIAGVNLASTEEALKQASRILGPAVPYETGDAANSDVRTCYRPAETTDRTRLYFHQGEVDEWFVLSMGVPTWERNTSCHPSMKISKNTGTASGLHLGQSQQDVIAILGLPTRRSHNASTDWDFMAYDFQIRKKASKQELDQAREQNPSTGEQELEKNYGFYDLSETIEAKFVNNRLNSLDVHWLTTD